MSVILANSAPSGVSASSANTANTPTSCYHCGEECASERILFQEKNFCCEGCRTVFDILQTNDMGQYYRLEAQPGTSLRSQKKERYAWLDDETIAAQLLDFQDENVAKVTFELPQIHCASCIWLLENLYRLNEGVLASKVNFLKKEAYLTYDPQALNLRSVVELLSVIGYAPAIDLSSLGKAEKKLPKDRTFSYQIGVAGFAFGNIMLLSFPEYLGLTDVGFQRWFGYLNVLLALPVVAFSGRDYLRSAWQGLRQKHLNLDVPIALGMVALFGRSVFEIFTHTGAGYLDSLAGLVFFLLIGKWFQQRTYHRLSFERDYRSYFPIAATRLRNGEEVPVTLDRLDVGDNILVRNEELIPADGLLLKGRGRIDYSFVTGEAEPVRKESGERLFAGGRQQGEPIEITLTKKVSQSYLTQLWNDEAFSKNTTSHASRLADKFGRRFTFTVLAVAFATLAYWLPRDVGVAINAFTSVLIIACPCAIALSIPFTLGNAVRLFAKQHFFVKNTQAVEDLAEVDTVVFDKTGTITEVQGQVHRTPALSTDRESGASGASGLAYLGEPLSDEEAAAVVAVAKCSSHPVSRGILATVTANSASSAVSGVDRSEVTDFQEFIGQGTQAQAGPFFIEIKKAEAGTELRIDGQRKGVFTHQNQFREGLENLLAQWKGDLQLHLLSGDNDRERERLSQFFPAENLHFDQSPPDKLAFIKNLQAQGRKVLMLGDGLNDAGALRQSDVGLVVAENTNNFTPASDGILDAKQFAALPQFRAFAKASIWVVYASYGVALVYNVIGLSFAVQGLLSPVIAAILMPLSSITIVAFGVGMSSLVGRFLSR